ncbi:MAG TPA: GDSL-type esterase/lipase family protein [Anaerolineales bacterium]|jgi:lysophospholipase L1-like esterase|nr:GDSL-type esterase/lipase family protein [Anaerolineales bacterium]
MQILDGQLVAFLGDSITQHLVAVSDWMETQTDGLPPVGTPVVVDRHENRGWTTILENRIHLSYPERTIHYLNAGIGGHSSRQMLARFDSDILAHPPQWLLLSAGVVEVRRRYQPEREQDCVSLNEYRANLIDMLTKARNADIQVILLEPTPHARPVTDGPPNVMLEEVNRLTQQYAEVMRQVTHETGAGFVSLFETFLDVEHRLKGKASLYADEVHLNSKGDLLYSQLVYQYLDSD